MAPQQQTAGQPVGAWSSRRESGLAMQILQPGARRLGKGGQTSGERCSSATFIWMRMFVGSADIPLRVRPQEVDARDGRQPEGLAAVRTGRKNVPPWLVFVHGFVLHGRRWRCLLTVRTLLVVQTIDGLGCRVSLGQDRRRNEGRWRNADTPGQGKRSQRDEENRMHGSGLSEREREHGGVFTTRGAMSQGTHSKCAGTTATGTRS